MSKGRKILLAVMGWTLVFIVLGEITLRVQGKWYTYAEKTSGKYASFFKKGWHSHYHTWTPGDSQLLEYAEFSYPYVINEYGFRDADFAVPKTRKRFIFLGDSYTEGMGAPVDSSYPRLFGDMCTAIESRCAGVSGSDPFYGYRMLKDKLLAEEPDFAFITINYSDLSDLVGRGGMERFKEDGTCRFRPAPWWEPLYRFSHLVRFAVHKGGKTDQSFISTRNHAEFMRPYVEEYIGLFHQMDSLCKANDIQWYVILQPNPSEHFDWEYPSSFVRQHVRPRIAETDIPFIDLYPHFEKLLDEETVHDYSWPIDMHYNSRGYHKLAEFLFEEISLRHPDICSPDSTTSGQL